MGYLDNKTISVDAILTKKGRELLSKGEFKVTQFALADDEIDYTLWSEDHPLGSNYYGAVIEGMPLLEAFPDETMVMRYKLVTLPKNTAKMPILSVRPGTLSFKRSGQQATLTPSTENGSNDNLGYTAILHDSSIATIAVAPGGEVANQRGSVPLFLGDEDDRSSVSVVGTKFVVTAKNNPLGDITTQVTLIGNQTGGQVVVTLTVKTNS